jgi:N6-adenosine-specific RNA methylase IME4
MKTAEMTHWPFANPFMGDVLERGRYGAILLDPPWEFVTYTGSGTPHRTEVDHYDVMSIEDLRRLPVQDLAAKDCVLVMWVIGSHLDQAIELGKHWGFKFKSDGFVWVKVGKNDPKVRPITMGHWTRKQTEYVLLFTRGSPKRLDAGVRQLFETDGHVIYAPRREHSRKPDDSHDRVVRLTGGPYVELFARERRPGWSSWGKEVGKFPLVYCDPEINEMLGLGVDEDIIG